MPTLLITATGAGTWTVPEGVTSVDYQIVGGGGGGAGSSEGGRSRIRDGADGGDTTFGGSTAGGGGGGGRQPGAGGTGDTAGSPGANTEAFPNPGGASGAPSDGPLAGYGDGGDGSRVFARGGGGGGYTSGTLTVTAGQQISYSVGAGGVGGRDSVDGEDGENGAIFLLWAGSTPTTTVTANAGPDRNVASGGTVSIGGTDTIIGGSGTTMISWVRITGQGGSLDDATIAEPTFTAPTLDPGAADRVITWRKTVLNSGAVGTDDVIVTVIAPLSSSPFLITNPGSGTWKVPAGVTSVDYQIVGGGGGGAGSSESGRSRIRDGADGGDTTFGGSTAGGGGGGGRQPGAGGTGDTAGSPGANTEAFPNPGGASGAPSDGPLAGYGDGGDGSRVFARGGGGGGYTSGTLTVTAGQQISYSVGAGGVGGRDSVDGEDGENGAIRLSWVAVTTTITANAGPDKNVASGGSVGIGGTDTIENGSGATVVSWSRVSGQGGSLDDTSIAEPTFTAPTLARGLNDRPIRWRKTVSNNGQEDTDDVIITVIAPPLLPVAEAPSVTVNAVAAGQEGSTVTLGARLSGGRYDGAVEYVWSVSGGSLNSRFSSTPVWTRPTVTGATNYTISLTITVRGSDVTARVGSSDTASDSVTARVTDATPPVPFSGRATADYPDGTATLTAASPLNVEVAGTGSTNFRTGAAQLRRVRPAGVSIAGKVSDPVPDGAANLFVASGVTVSGPGSAAFPDATAALTVETIPFANKGSANFPAQTVVLGRTLPLPVAGKDSAAFPAGSAALTATFPPPVLQSRVTNTTGSEVILTFDRALDETSVPDNADFQVFSTVGVDPDTVSVTVTGSTVVVGVSPSLLYGSVILIGYTVGENPVQSTKGTPTAAFEFRVVQNNIAEPDMIPPVFESAETDPSGTQITITFDDQLDEDSVPAASAFTISPARTISSVAVDVAGTVTLTFGTAVDPGEAVTVAYTQPATNPLQDPIGNEVLTFAAQRVENNVPLTPVEFILRHQQNSNRPFGLNFYAVDDGAIPADLVEADFTAGALLAVFGSGINTDTSGELQVYRTRVGQQTSFVAELRAAELIVETLDGSTQFFKLILNDVDGSAPYQLPITYADYLVFGANTGDLRLKFNSPPVHLVEKGTARFGVGSVDILRSPPVRLGSHSVVTLPDGQASLTGIPPDDVSLGGTGEATVGGNASLGIIRKVELDGRGGARFRPRRSVLNRTPPTPVTLAGKAGAAFSAPAAVRLSRTAPAPVTFGGRGAVTVPAGSARLTGVPPDDVSLGGLGMTTSPDLTAELLVTPPADVSVANKSSAAFPDGIAALAVTPPADITVTVKGGAVFPAGSAQLATTAPGDLEFSGRGEAAFAAGVASLSSAPPEDVAVADKGSTAFPAGASELTAIPPLGVAGKGSMEFPAGAASITAIPPPSFSIAAKGSALFRIRPRATPLRIRGPDPITLGGTQATTFPPGQVRLSTQAAGDIGISGKGSAAFGGGASMLTGIMPPSISLGGETVRRCLLARPR